MAKPIQETIFKSRLTITYRTNITGTVQQESLPYRLLVLGEFSSKANRLLPDLASREVKSIKRGTTVDDHLKETVPIWRIPGTPELKALRSSIPGKLTFDAVTCDVPLGAIERNESGTFPISGRARFASSIAENGLCDMGAKEIRVTGLLTVTISGGVVTAVSAELTAAGAMASYYADPATGKTAGVASAFLEVSMPVKSGVTLAPSLDPTPDQAPKTQQFQVTMAAVPVAAERTVPFASVEAFAPDKLAVAIPELRRLLVIKQLLADLQSGLRNRPELRKLMKSLLPEYGASAADAQKKLAPFEGLKKWATESYPLLKIDSGGVS